MIKTVQQFEKEYRDAFNSIERKLILDEIKRNPMEYNLKGLRKAGGYQALINLFENILIDIKSGLNNVKIQQKSTEFGMFI